MIPRLAVAVGIGVWILTILTVGMADLGSSIERGLVLGAWVALPATVALSTAIEPTCNKRQAIIFTLGSGIPIIGVIPASVYLGTLNHEH
jgi:hypothetical protein